MDFRSCAFPPRRRFAFLRSPPRVCPPRAVCLGEIAEDTVRQSGGTCADPLLSRLGRRPRRTLPAQTARGSLPTTSAAVGVDAAVPEDPPRPHDPATPDFRRLPGYTGVYRGVAEGPRGTENPIRQTLRKK